MCSSFWRGLLVAMAMNSSVFALEELPAEKVVLGDRTLRVGQMYKAHGEVWTPQQCLYVSGYTATLEECKTACTNEYRCNAFNHHASDSQCDLLGCPLPYPKPIGSYEGWKGYSIDAGISCPQDFIPFGNQCLYFNNGNFLVWPEAAEACKDMNASLIVPDDTIKILPYVEAGFGTGIYWIGGYYKMPEAYIAHDKFWGPRQCTRSYNVFTATLEECKTACSSDYYCTAFHHHASKSACHFVICSVPAPEPLASGSGWMGYSVEPGNWLWLNGEPVQSENWLWLNGEPLQSDLLMGPPRYKDSCLGYIDGVLSDISCLELGNYICMTASLDQENPKTTSLPLVTASTASTERI